MNNNPQLHLHSNNDQPSAPTQSNTENVELSKVGASFFRRFSCGEFCKFLDGLTKGEPSEAPTEAFNNAVERGFIEAVPRESLYLSQSKLDEIMRLEVRDRELNRGILHLRDESFLAEYSIRHLTQKTSGISGLVLWLVGNLSATLDLLNEAKTRQRQINNEKRDLETELENNSSRRNIIEGEKRKLAEKRDLFIESPAQGVGVRITDRGRAILAFMNAYGVDLEGVPYSSFLQGSIKLGEAMQRQTTQIVSATGSLIEMGVSNSIASQFGVISPFYSGKEPFSERVLALAIAVEQSELPTKDLVGIVRAMVLMPGSALDIVEKTVTLYQEGVRQGMEQSIATLQAIMPLLVMSEERGAPDRLIDSLLVVSERIERNLGSFKLTPVSVHYLASRLLSAEAQEARLERFESTVQYLLDLGFPTQIATLFVAAQLSTFETPFRILVPQAISRMNAVFDRWGRNPQLIGTAFEIAITPGVVSANLMIIEDMCERLRQCGVEGARLQRAIPLFRQLQAEAYGSRISNCEPPFSEGMLATPHEALLLLAPALFFESLKGPTEEHSHQRSEVLDESNASSMASARVSESMIDMNQTFSLLTSEGSLPFSSSDLSGFSFSSFALEGLSASGFDSGGFGGAGGYDSGFSSSSYDGGGSSGSFDSGGMSSSSSCGSSSSSCSSSSGGSSCGGGGGCGAS